MYSILNNVNSDKDIAGLDKKECAVLCSEIRDFLISNVGKTGGHLASNLGVVELTVALHRVFNLEEDRIIFDVGHQSYTHKILTGRKDRFGDLRRPGGLSGFTNISESKYDTFGAGHSSTSISAALGFAQADKLDGRESYTVAVIGDGAFTGGMVHEALNNCNKGLNLIIVLNENEMSISRNTGRFSRLIARLRVSKGYVETKAGISWFLRKIPLIGKPIYKLIKKIKSVIKRNVVNYNYFEQMGLEYIGPGDGNNQEQTEMLLKKAKECGRVVVVHLKTKKGKGLEEAEQNPKFYHNFNPKHTNEKTFNSEFGRYMTELAEKDEKVVAITAAMGFGTGLDGFSEKFPNRYFDVGIAEEHAMTFAAGLACAGYKPYFAVYSTFLQRAYDNIVHDVALQGLPVRICIDRAGLAPSDGATHHGIFDVSLISAIPNMKLYAPATLGSFEEVLKDTAEVDTPCAIRYSNSTENKRVVSEFYPQGDFQNYGVRANKGAFDSDAYVVNIITYGKIVSEALKAEDKLAVAGIACRVILLERLKPYDEIAEKVMDLICENRGKIIFLEEGIKNGGAGMLLADAIAKINGGSELICNFDYKIMAIDDNFAIPDKICDLYKYCKLDFESIVGEIFEKNSENADVFCENC